MKTFSPPTTFEASIDFFWGRFPVEVGVSVVKVGGHFVSMPYPWMGTLAGLQDGVDYFLGGHIYQVEDDVAAALIADGYTVPGIGGKPLTDHSFGRGGFGTGPFGG